MKKIFLSFFILLIAVHAQAASLTTVSDLVSTSVKNASATHSIQFTVTNAIPVSGHIVIIPEAGSFSIPTGFDYTDIDLLVATSGPYINRDITSVASATEDGVAVVTGSSGSITITLNSTEGITAGSRIRVLLGTNASYATVGDISWINPSVVGSYRLNFTTTTQGGAPIDDAKTHIVIVQQVGVTSYVDYTPPILSNGLPSGTISFNNSTIEISLNTNELSNCRYATTSGIAYSAMTNIFSSVNTTLHTKVISGHQDDTAYTYYVRCADLQGAQTTDDFPISFDLEATPTIPVSTGQTGSSGSGGVTGSGGTGAFPNGSASLFLATVNLSGFTSPSSDVTVLKDGEQVEKVRSGSDGKFQSTISNIERGAYTFNAYSTDSKNRKSATFSSTLSLGQGTNNNLSNVVIPPTIELDEATVPVGGTVRVSGETIPGATVEVYVLSSGSSALGSSNKYTATSTQGVVNVANGLWEVTFPTASLSQGTYQIKARTLYSDQAKSSFSGTVFLGLGEEPSPDFSTRADINQDGKINLTDFSIMLTFWGGANESADVNADGSINLADFSILLFNWTG